MAAPYRRKRAESKPRKLVSLLLLIVVVGVGIREWPAIQSYFKSFVRSWTVSGSIMDEDFQHTSSLGKTAVARYWVANGNPPSSNAQAGLDGAETYRRGSVLRMEVVPGGSIVFVMTQQSGSKYGQVTLVPDSTGLMQGVIKWECVTPSFPDMPDCEYRP